MQAVSYSEAREKLKSMIDKVVADRAPLAITRQRGEGAVLVSASEWASIEETLYLLEAVRGFETNEADAIPFP
jgi:antitoxin YefM